MRNTTVTLVTLVASGLLAAGCDAPFGGDEPDLDASCPMPFTEYSAGSSVAGLELEARVPNCGKRPFVGYIYGTCEASSDSGCAPPLEVQSWSARDRRPRAAPGNQVELRRGDVTIVIFAHSRRLAAAAQRSLRAE